MRDFLRNEFNQFILTLLFIISGTLCLDLPKGANAPNFENRIYTSNTRALSVDLGDTFLQLAPLTSVRTSFKNGRVSLGSLMGKVEINIPANRSVHVQAEDRDLEFSSLDGARIQAEGFFGGVQIRNVAGDVLLKTGGRTIAMRKLTFAAVTNGQLEISYLNVPVLISPKVSERMFKSSYDGEVVFSFKAPLFIDARIEYVVRGWADAIVARGNFEGQVLKLNLPVGEYRVMARTRRANEYSGWTVPRAFSIWAKPNQVATAF